jgi:hypothetical protein
MLGGPQPARAATSVPATGTVRPLAPTVSPGGHARLRVNVLVRRPLSQVTLRLRVRTPAGDMAAPIQTVSAPRISAGRITYDFIVDMPSGKGREGTYPFSVTMSARGSSVWRGLGRLLVVDARARPPMLLCLVWTFDPGLHMRPDEAFTDGVVAGSIDPSSRPRGRVLAHALQLRSHSRIRESVALAPLLAYQLERLASGSVEVSGETTIDSPAGSKPARDARSALAIWRSLAQSGRAEILSTPFADAPLEVLARRGIPWDIRLQLDTGAGTLAHSLEVTPTPWLVRSATDTRTARALRSAGVHTLVLDAAAVDATVGGHGGPFLLAADKRLRAVAIDPALSSVLTPGLAEPTQLDDLMAALAERFRDGQRVAVLSAPAGSVDERLLAGLYADVEETAWIRTAGLSEAFAGLVPAGTVGLRRAPAERSADPLWHSLISARGDYLAVRSLILPEDPLGPQLLRTLMVAEDVTQPRASALWQDALRRRAAPELSAVHISANPSLMLTGQRGKFALSLSNTGSREMTPLLLLSGDGVSFPDGRRVRLDLRPKETVSTIRVALIGARTHGQVVARLVAGDHVLDQAVLSVSASYIDRLALVAGIILALGGLLFYLWRRRAAGEYPEEDD